MPLTPEAIAVLQSIPRRKTTGLIAIRDQGKIATHEQHSAQFVFPKEVVEICKDKSVIRSFQRVDSIKRSWATILKSAGIKNLQIKDLRTYFNHKLISQYGFSDKEAGSYIGNTAEVNRKHYNPISADVIRQKICKKTSLST